MSGASSTFDPTTARHRKIVVGYSGGVTSAWCAWWALQNYQKDEVVWLFHDTKEEDPDTYRFIKQFSEVVGHPVTEVSDGRSVTELCYDEDMLPNQQAAFCSRVLKQEQRSKYIKELRDGGITDITIVLGFSDHEWQRIQRATAVAEREGVKCRFPLVETGTTKQEIVSWLECELKVPPPSMYKWSNHANCVGCFRGGKAYWLAVHKNRPDVFLQRLSMEKEFGHTIQSRYSLEDTLKDGMKRAPKSSKDSIEIGVCECGG